MNPRRIICKKIRDINRSKLQKYAGYIAGLVDGEGSLIIRWDKRHRYLTFSYFMSIGMTHEGVIKWLSDILGVTYSVSKRKPPRKTMYVLRVFTQTDLVTLLEELLPWLIVKKEQAETMLRFLNLRAERSAKEYANEKAELYLKMRKLNQRGKGLDLEKERKAIFQRIEILQKEG